MRKLRLLAGVVACATAFTLSGGAEEPKKEVPKEAPKKEAPKDPKKTPSNPNATTTPVPRDAGWMKRHDSFLEVAKKGDVDVLFIGDSITDGWRGQKAWDDFKAHKPANFGIGGDRTEHVLWRITTGKELEGISPKAVVIMIGTNNAGSNTPEQIADGVKAIVAEFRKQKPDAKILLLGVFPRADRNANPGPVAPKEKLNTKIPEINAIIAKLDDGKMVKYLDIGPKFLNADGGLEKAVMPDLLHLSAKGYQIWADAIKEPLGELVK